MKLIFWFCFFAIGYTLIGYPLWLWMLAKLRPKPVRKRCPLLPEELPTVSVIVIVRNEAARIERRLANLLEQTYPPSSMQIIVVDDGSTDETAFRAQSWMQTRSDECALLLIRHASSRGKSFGIDSAVERSTGEILVFCDARQRFTRDTMLHLVLNFTDPRVGCVSGELVFETSEGSQIQVEMGSYWKFEKWVRSLESRTGSVAGATGAVYAIRKSLFRPIPARTILDDVLIPMQAALQGYRIVFDHEAVAYDVVSKDMQQEGRRKIRTLAGNWQLLFLEPNLAHPLKNPVWFRFLSHKICRLFVPYWGLCMALCALVIRDGVSIAFLAAFSVMLGLAFFPLSIRLSGSPLGKAARMVRAVVYLYAFAAIAPFRLLFSPKSLWSS
ncbi:MAG: glycosyltransferase family 2 protein [Thermodesulfobacteriota bacterium]